MISSLPCRDITRRRIFLLFARRRSLLRNYKKLFCNLYALYSITRDSEPIQGILVFFSCNRCSVHGNHWIFVFFKNHFINSWSSFIKQRTQKPVNKLNVLDEISFNLIQFRTRVFHKFYCRVVATSIYAGLLITTHVFDFGSVENNMSLLCLLGIMEEISSFGFRFWSLCDINEHCIRVLSYK